MGGKIINLTLHCRHMSLVNYKCEVLLYLIA